MISCSKFEIACSLCIHIVIYFGGLSLSCTLFRNVKHGLWSENCFVRMPDFGCFAYLSILQNRLSIRVPLLFENLVGSVICG